MEEDFQQRVKTREVLETVFIESLKLLFQDLTAKDNGSKRNIIGIDVFFDVSTGNDELNQKIPLDQCVKRFCAIVPLFIAGFTHVYK